MPAGTFVRTMGPRVLVVHATGVPPQVASSSVCELMVKPVRTRLSVAISGSTIWYARSGAVWAALPQMGV